MADPMLALGIIAGLGAGFLMYRRDVSWTRTFGVAVYFFLMLGTPFFFILFPLSQLDYM